MQSETSRLRNNEWRNEEAKLLTRNTKTNDPQEFPNFNMIFLLG